MVRPFTIVNHRGGCVYICNHFLGGWGVYICNPPPRMAKRKPPATNAASGTNTELPKTLDDRHESGGCGCRAVASQNQPDSIRENFQGDNPPRVTAFLTQCPVDVGKCALLVLHRAIATKGRGCTVKQAVYFFCFHG